MHELTGASIKMVRHCLTTSSVQKQPIHYKNQILHISAPRNLTMQTAHYLLSFLTCPTKLHAWISAESMIMKTITSTYSKCRYVKTTWIIRKCKAFKERQ